MTNHTQFRSGKVTATDTHGVIGDNFWPELKHRIARAGRMTPVEASKMMGKFLFDNCDRWPYIKAIGTSADLRAMYERALEIRNAPTAEATARWEREYDSRLGSDDAVKNLVSNLYRSARVGWAAAEYNLEKVGMIEMIQGHHAGVMLPGDVLLGRPSVDADGSRAARQRCAASTHHAARPAARNCQVGR
jgi:hypothetical protein